MTRVLVLNSDFNFINFISWQRAVTLMMKNKVEVVAESTNTIKSADGSEFNIPTVVRLLKMIKIIFKRETPYSKRSIFIRDNYVCQYCGKQLKEKGTIDEKPQLEHIIPASRGGKSTWLNTTTSCNTCNSKKGDKTPEEAGMTLIRKPYKPSIKQFMAKRAEIGGVDKILKEVFESFK